MIVVDSSALVAILRREPEANEFLRVIADSGTCLLSSVSLLETSMVLAGRTGSEAAWTDLDAFILRAGMQVVPQDAQQADGAREVFLRYGKGRHPAALGFGDCATYALAKVRGAALLFKGDDFSQTDLLRAA